jgi:hypothetical protein
MNKEDVENVVSVITSAIIIGAMVFFIIWMFRELPITALKREAIERNFAEYNSTTGVWQWKTNR